MPWWMAIGCCVAGAGRHWTTLRHGRVLRPPAPSCEVDYDRRRFMTRLIIDTDPGVDDAHAIMLAFAHPAAQVEAITTVSGNVSLDRTTANACTILDVLERDVPVYAGCTRALVHAAPDASYVHGSDGLGDSGFA